MVDDFVITFAQYFYLRRFRTGIRRWVGRPVHSLGISLCSSLGGDASADSVVSVLMLYCINTGLLTRCVEARFI